MKSKIISRNILFSLAGSFLLTISASPFVNGQNSKPAPVKTQKDSAIFKFKPQEQLWLVPAGVTKVHVDAYGAQGGSELGGKGGRVRSDLTVNPGSKLFIYVGSQPSGPDGGYNGGGKGCGKGYGGGGASDIRSGESGLESRIIVAGGGGGAAFGGNGGAGGGLTGGDSKSFYKEDYHIAKGGTQEAGGAGARAYLAQPGQAGIGGDGINNIGECANNDMAGGGGGYYGGGGSGAGGGGGGSSYTSKDNKNVVHKQGVNEGDGKIKIYWEKVVK